MKVFVLADIHRADAVVCAPQSFKSREKFHALYALYSASLTMDVDDSRYLRAAEIPVFARIVFLYYGPEIGIGEKRRGDALICGGLNGIIYASCFSISLFLTGAPFHRIFSSSEIY